MENAATKRAPEDARSARPRKAWLAFLLGLFVPGLGHVYAGALRRGAIVMAGYFLVLIPGVMFMRALLSISRTGAIAGLLVSVAIGLVLPVDAALAARQRRDRPLARWNRVWVYAAYAVAATLLFHTVGAWWAERQPFRTFKIPSGAMMDTLLIGDYVIVDMRKGKLTVPRRGEIVVFRKPQDPEVSVIKRIVGLPGEMIELRDGVLHVNGHSLGERYVGREYRERDPRKNFGPVEVMPDHYVVLGDRRNQSQDSRFFGQVPHEFFEGRARSVWWSAESVYDPLVPQPAAEALRQTLQLLNPGRIRTARFGIRLDPPRYASGTGTSPSG